MVVGSNFKIPATQQFKFVPLKKTEDEVFKSLAIPRRIDLKLEQSAVKSQGKRGACTYFVISSLVESLIKKKFKKELDISEEYIAWAGKVKNELRSFEEDSSVAVNALTVQQHGFMLESVLPYQTSWFDKGMPCEGKKKEKNIGPICYSHHGPDSKSIKKIINGKSFIFESVDSSSIDVVQAIAKFKSPVTASILAHPLIWSSSSDTGDLILTKELKEECLTKKANCGAHAVLIVGYDLDKKKFTFKNSWGDDWGAKGYGSITFDYMDQMSPRKFLTGYIDGQVEIP
jgi:C1A family cysteine protease